MQSASATASASPFVDRRSPVTAYEAAKMVVMAPVALARITLVLIILNLGNAVAWFGMESGRDVDGALRTAFALALAVAGVRMRVRGLEHLAEAEASLADTKEGCVVVFNHVSILDFVVLLRIRILAFLTHDDWRNLPLGTCFVDYADMVLIGDPRRVEGGQSVTDELVARARDPRRRMVAVAPEGTLSNGSCLLKFRTGAFAAMAPVLPVVLRYPFRHHNPAWTLEVPPAVKVFRILTQFVTPVELEILPLVRPADVGATTPAEFARGVREAMAAALGVPTVEQSNNDRLGHNY